METIATDPIFVGVFTVLVVLLVAGLLNERQHYKSLNTTLQGKLDIISQQNVEIISLESEIRNGYASLRNFEERCIIQGNAIAALVEASTHAMLTVDSRMCILHFNKRFCEMWDLAEEKIHVGMEVYTLLQHCMEKTLEPDIFFLKHHRIDHLQDATWETEAHLSDGKIFLSSSSPIQGIDDTYYGRIWEFIDITERVQEKQRLAEARCTIALQHEKLAATKEELRHQYVSLNTTHTELMHQNQILRILKEHLTGGLCIFDAKGNLSSFNQKFLDIWDTSGKELKKNFPLKSLMQTRAFALHNDADAQAALIHEILHDRTRFLHDEITLVNGTILERYSTPLIDEKGVYYGRLWEFIDITERLSREQELIAVRKDREDKNKLLHALLEASTHGIFAVDSDWRIIAVNKQFYNMWDLEDAIFIGDDGWKILMAYCMTQVVDPKTFIASCTLQGVPDVAWNNHLYLPNGRILKYYFAPIVGPDGTEHGKIWEFTDITDDLFQQQELERTHTTLIQKSLQLALALEGAGEGLWTWDTRTDLFLLNPEFASQYRSISETQTINQFFQSVPSSERELCLNIFRDITGKCPIEFEFQLQSNDGRWRFFILRGIVSEVDKDGVPLIATGTLVDITERKRYEKHLHESNHKMVVLSQITRHDITNQLNTLFGISDALSDSVSGADTKHLLELLEQSLVATMHQIEFQRDYQELGVHGAEWQDVHACIEKIKSLLILRSNRQEKGVELLADDLPVIFADPLLEKAVYNLIENSLRHGECVTQIKVTFSVQDSHNGILTFKDNGVGIPDVHKNRIFDEGFGKNTGHGLFLIREIFSLTGMSIHECGIPGQGAQFEITVPAGYWKW